MSRGFPEFYVKNDGTGYCTHPIDGNFVISFPCKRDGLSTWLRPSKNLKVFSLLRQDLSLVREKINFQECLDIVNDIPF